MKEINGLYIWKKGEDDGFYEDFKMSPTFPSSSFECASSQAGEQQMMAAELIELLFQVQNLLGKPIEIVEGYRTLFHNIDKGGHPESEHLRGRAVKIKPKYDQDFERLLKICASVFRERAIGVNPGKFIHLDLRNDRRRRWEYK